MTFSRERSTTWTERTVVRLNDRLGIMADCQPQEKDVEEFKHDHLTVVAPSTRKCKVLLCLS